MSNTSILLVEQGLDLSHLFALDKGKAVIAQWSIRNYKKGDFIYLAQSEADRVFLVKEGKVKLMVQQQDKALTKLIATENDFFGYLPLVVQGGHTNTAVALTNTTVYAIPSAALRALMLENAAVNGHFMRMIGKRVMRTERRLEALLFDTARTRVIHYLLELAEDKGTRVGFETLVRNLLSHQEIGNITSTSRQTVSTILSELRRKNLIHVNRRQLLIRDLGQLEAAIQDEA